MTQYNIVPSGASISDVTDKFKKSPHFFHVVMLDSADALCGVKSKHLCFDTTQYGTEDDLDCPVCRRKLAKLTGSEGAKGTNMTELILFRGLPGAGKSTLASALCDVCLSADDFFTDAEGAYHYDKSKIKAAHEDCLTRTAEAMARGVERIGVANTFTEAWEMEPYFHLADVEGYRIHAVIIEARGHYRQNVHGTPISVINYMRSRFNISL